MTVSPLVASFAKLLVSNYRMYAEYATSLPLEAVENDAHRSSNAPEPESLAECLPTWQSSLNARVHRSSMLLQECHSQVSARDQERLRFISVPHGMCVCTSAGYFFSAWICTRACDGLHAGNSVSTPKTWDLIRRVSDPWYKRGLPCRDRLCLAREASFVIEK